MIAVDWSGRGGVDQAKYIWLGETIGGELTRLECGRSRVEIVRHLVEVAEHDPNFVVGLDFAFSVPAWFLLERMIASPRDLWKLLASQALTPQMEEIGLAAWIEAPEPPFWKAGKPSDLSRDREFRRTDLEVAGAGAQPKSVFQFVGGGQVGRSSLYGMQALHELAAAGFHIWPFDDPIPPVVIEIFPRTLTGPVVKSDCQARTDYLAARDLPKDARVAAIGSEDAFDALISVIRMTEQRDALMQLRREPEYAREGKIWTIGDRSPDARRGSKQSAEIVPDHVPGRWLQQIVGDVAREWAKEGRGNLLPNTLIGDVDFWGEVERRIGRSPSES